jgi:hypothetical protein
MMGCILRFEKMSKISLEKENGGFEVKAMSLLNSHDSLFNHLILKACNFILLLRCNSVVLVQENTGSGYTSSSAPAQHIGVTVLFTKVG